LVTIQYTRNHAWWIENVNDKQETGRAAAYPHSPGVQVMHYRVIDI